VLVASGVVSQAASTVSVLAVLDAILRICPAPVPPTMTTSAPCSDVVPNGEPATVSCVPDADATVPEIRATTIVSSGTTRSPSDHRSNSPRISMTCTVDHVAGAKTRLTDVPHSGSPAVRRTTDLIRLPSSPAGTDGVATTTSTSVVGTNASRTSYWRVTMPPSSTRSVPTSGLMMTAGASSSTISAPTPSTGTPRYMPLTLSATEFAMRPLWPSRSLAWTAGASCATLISSLPSPP
jgi:hypothetical protein